MKSESQRRYLWSQHPEIAKRWEKHTPDKKLPEKVKDKKAFWVGFNKFVQEKHAIAFPGGIQANTAPKMPSPMQPSIFPAPQPVAPKPAPTKAVTPVRSQPATMKDSKSAAFDLGIDLFFRQTGLNKQAMAAAAGVDEALLADYLFAAIK